MGLGKTSKEVKARNRLSYAVRHKNIIKPDRCSSCGAMDRPNKAGNSTLQGHHHNGYDDALDVVWLCALCHSHLTPRYDYRGHSMNVGDKNGRAKLTPEQIVEIRSSKQSNRALGTKYSVDHKTISDIKTRKTWSHVQ